MQGICNKFIEVNFCVGCMVWPPNRMFQDWTFVKYWWEMYFNGIGFTSISLNRPPTHSDGTEMWTVWPRTCSTCTWWEFTKCFITLWIAPSSVYREILRPYCMHLTLLKKTRQMAWDSSLNFKAVFATSKWTEIFRLPVPIWIDDSLKYLCSM